MDQIKSVCVYCSGCIFDEYEHGDDLVHGEPIGCSISDDFEHQLCAQSNEGCSDFSERIDD